MLKCSYWSFLWFSGKLIFENWLISKFMTSQTVQEIIRIHILPNIFRSKSNHTMTFCQLMEYNVRNIFLQKLCTKCGGEASSRPFYKNQNWAYLWTNSLKCYKVCFFFLCSSQGLIKLFYKWKRGLELVSLPHSRQDFWTKIFLPLYAINWPNLVVWLPLLLKELGNMCILIISCPV